jgi:hypothetical protein
MSEFIYEIDENNTVRIYRLSQQPEPIGLQPYYPDNRPFEDRAAAEKWAQDCIANLENPPVTPEQ